MANKQADTEEQAIMAYEDAINQGLSTGDALKAATIAQPAAAAFIADYALASRATAAEGNEADGLDALVLQRATSLLAAKLAPKPKFAGILAAAKSIGLDLPGLSTQLELARSVIVKLDRRLIEPASIPPGALARIAEAINTTVVVLTAYLGGAPTLPSSASYRSVEAPEIDASGRESFGGALRVAVGTGEMREEAVSPWAE